MKYDYNGNLTFEERIEEVSLDIINQFPNISVVDAMKVASLEEPINRDINDEFKFKRLYNILFVRNDMYEEIYNEILKLDLNNELIKSGLIKLVECRKKNFFPIYNNLIK